MGEYCITVSNYICPVASQLQADLMPFIDHFVHKFQEHFFHIGISCSERKICGIQGSFYG